MKKKTSQSATEQKCLKMHCILNLEIWILTVLLCCSVSTPAFSQQRKPAPKKQTTAVSKPKVTTFEFYLYEDGTFKKTGDTDYYVVDFGTKSAHQLYMDVLANISSVYRNPERVTSKVEDRTIVVNGYADDVTYYQSSFSGYTTTVSFKYRIELQFKEGKIRVNAPTLVEMYKSNALGTDKLSEYPSMFGFFSGVIIKPIKQDIDKYINLLIKDIVYGSDDDNW